MQVSLSNANILQADHLKSEDMEWSIDPEWTTYMGNVWCAQQQQQQRQLNSSLKFPIVTVVAFKPVRPGSAHVVIVDHEKPWARLKIDMFLINSSKGNIDSWPPWRCHPRDWCPWL